MILTLNTTRGGEEVFSVRWKPKDVVSTLIKRSTDFGDKASVGTIGMVKLFQALSQGLMYNDRISFNISLVLKEYDFTDVEASIDPLG